MKKLLSMLLALTMLIPSSATVFAEETETSSPTESAVTEKVEEEVKKDAEETVEQKSEDETVEEETGESEEETKKEEVSEEVTTPETTTDSETATENKVEESEKKEEEEAPAETETTTEEEPDQKEEEEEKPSEPEPEVTPAPEQETENTENTEDTTVNEENNNVEEPNNEETAETPKEGVLITNEALKNQLNELIKKRLPHDGNPDHTPNATNIRVVTEVTEVFDNYFMPFITLNLGDKYDSNNDSILDLNVMPVIYYDVNGVTSSIKLSDLTYQYDQEAKQPTHINLVEDLQLTFELPENYSEAHLKELGFNPIYDLLIKQPKKVGALSTPSDRNNFVKTNYEFVNNTFKTSVKSLSTYGDLFKGIEFICLIKNAKPSLTSFVDPGKEVMDELQKKYPNQQNLKLRTECNNTGKTIELDGKNALVYDINLFVYGNDQKQHQITNLENSITINVVLPNLKDGAIYDVYRQHGDDPEYHKIGTSSKAKDGIISFTSDKFSNYAFVKIVDGKTVTPPTPTDNKPTPVKKANVKHETHVQPHPAPNGSVWNELTGMFDAKPGYKWDDAKQMFVKDATANKNTSTVNGLPSTGDEGLNMYICMLVMSLVAIGGLGYKLKHSNH